MKRKSIISMLLLSMMLGMFSTSCQDMLSPNSERHAYTVAEDSLYTYWGILKSLQNIAERYVILNECRGDLVDETNFVSDSIAAIVNFGETGDPEKWWKDGACSYLRIRDYYHVINSCNAYIAMCDTKRTKGTGALYMMKEYAQVQSIRAWVYMQLLYAYGEERVPFYTEPMLSTDDINSFLASKSDQKLTIQKLREVLIPELEKVEPVEIKLSDPQYQDLYQGMPNYNNYGDEDPENSHFVCHSSMCLFPVSIVMGDLLLLSGDYEAAAQHYYNYIYLSGRCGPLSPNRYFSIGYFNKNLGDQSDPLYEWTTSPYYDRTAVSTTNEAITCIPSNKGKLEGKVLTDINRLFGFEAQMRTSNDEGAGASVGLSRVYEHELGPSEGYETLCKSQKYEVYTGTPQKTSEGTTWNNLSLQVLDDVGDARRSWILNSSGRQWTFSVGDDIMYGKMVSKQNPNGAFSTTYPVVYRKSTVWLRFAEALNRAGFPGYAFAILKSGICNHPDWLPEDPAEKFKLMPDRKTMYGALGYDYTVKPTDTLFCYKYTVKDATTNKSVDTYLPEDWETNPIRSWEDILAWYKSSEYITAADASLSNAKLLAKVRNNIYWKPQGENSFENIPDTNCMKACNHISLTELQRASGKNYLNFGNLTGSSYQWTINITEETKMRTESPNLYSQPFANSINTKETYTIGVHQRGCGLMIYSPPADRIKECQSTFNYVDQVKNKIKETSGKDVDKDYVYDAAHELEVIEAVEDLIVDEMALELAFEGTRFSDLFRVAQRRGEDYLAKRVAKRHTGEVDENLRSRLNNKENWFLPVPVY